MSLEDLPTTQSASASVETAHEPATTSAFAAIDTSDRSPSSHSAHENRAPTAVIGDESETNESSAVLHGVGFGHSGYSSQDDMQSQSMASPRMDDVHLRAQSSGDALLSPSSVVDATAERAMRDESIRAERVVSFEGSDVAGSSPAHAREMSVEGPTEEEEASEPEEEEEDEEAGEDNDAEDAEAGEEGEESSEYEEEETGGSEEEDEHATKEIYAQPIAASTVVLPLSVRGADESQLHAALHTSSVSYVCAGAPVVSGSVGEQYTRFAATQGAPMMAYSATQSVTTNPALTESYSSLQGYAGSRVISQTSTPSAAATANMREYFKNSSSNVQTSSTAQYVTNGAMTAPASYGSSTLAGQSTPSFSAVQTTSSTYTSPLTTGNRTIGSAANITGNTTSGAAISGPGMDRRYTGSSAVGGYSGLSTIGVAGSQIAFNQTLGAQAVTRGVTPQLQYLPTAQTTSVRRSSSVGHKYEHLRRGTATSTAGAAAPGQTMSYPRASVVAANYQPAYSGMGHEMSDVKTYFNGHSASTTPARLASKVVSEVYNLAAPNISTGGTQTVTTVTEPSVTANAFSGFPGVGISSYGGGYQSVAPAAAYSSAHVHGTPTTYAQMSVAAPYMVSPSPSPAAPYMTDAGAYSVATKSHVGSMRSTVGALMAQHHEGQEIVVEARDGVSAVESSARHARKHHGAKRAAKVRMPKRCSCGC